MIQKSTKTRKEYLKKIELNKEITPNRTDIPCANIAHVLSTNETLLEKEVIQSKEKKNIAIITSYNDMLSAHKPYQKYPGMIRSTLLQEGHSAQVAGATPAMCDGITQGEIGMELSLFSRDVIAMSTAVGLSHNVFDGVILLGICDKIVPGLLMGALTYGHLPMIFIPSGPMETGISNKEKSKARELYAKGEISKSKLLNVESQSYHSTGTCTFYGTANSNQLVLEAMGLMLPGSAFIAPHTKLRNEMTKLLVDKLFLMQSQKKHYFIKREC